MRVRPAITLTSGMPTVGVLLGTGGSADLMNRITDALGSTTWFQTSNDVLSAAHNTFIRDVVQPIQATANLLGNVITSLVRPDKYYTLAAEEDLGYIPPVMHLPILMYPPVRRLLEQGRIDGFGYDPENLPDEDVYGRLTSNGVVEDVCAAIDPETGDAPLYYEWWSDDPEISVEEIVHIADTREYIQYILDNTDFDPTSYPNTRG